MNTIELTFRKLVSKHLEDSSPCWLGESAEAQIERTIGQQPAHLYRISNSFGGHETVPASEIDNTIEWLLENGIEPSNIKIEVV